MTSKLLQYRLFVIFLYSTIIILSTTVANAIEIQKEDRNNDGKADLWIYYENKRPVRIEGDRNYDGRIDIWINYAKGGHKTIEVDLNFDGIADMHSVYQYGQRVKFEIDTDYDGKLNQRTEYYNGKVVKLERDTDSDGKLETIFDISGRVKNTMKKIETENLPQQ